MCSEGAVPSRVILKPVESVKDVFGLSVQMVDILIGYVGSVPDIVNEFPEPLDFLCSSWKVLIGLNVFIEIVYLGLHLIDRCVMLSDFVNNAFQNIKQLIDKAPELLVLSLKLMDLKGKQDNGEEL